MLGLRAYESSRQAQGSQLEAGQGKEISKGSNRVSRSLPTRTGQEWKGAQRKHLHF